MIGPLRCQRQSQWRDSCRRTTGCHSCRPTHTKPSPSSCGEDYPAAFASDLTQVAISNRLQKNVSVQDNPATVDKYIANEVAKGRLTTLPGAVIHRNPIRIILKQHYPQKFRLIIDLSAPCGLLQTRPHGQQRS